MTFIHEIDDKDALERLRLEILGNVERRSEQETNAMNRLATYMGLVCSGSTIAIMSFIGQQIKTGVPISAVVALACFVCALLSLAYCLYWLFQLHSARWAHSANVAQAFFIRDAELEDVLEASRALQTRLPFRLLFWLPFTFLTMGFVLSGIAIIFSAPQSAPAAGTSSFHVKAS